MDENNKTYFPEEITNQSLPTDGIPIIQPREQLPVDTLASPVLPDSDLTLFDSTTKYTNSSASSQSFNTITNFGKFIKIDAIAGRIIINDGKHDRIIIGFYPL